MIDSNEIEVRAVVSLNALVLQCREEKIIETIEEQPLDMEKIHSMPGITVYMVKQGDTLWDIDRKSTRLNSSHPSSSRMPSSA